jgi:hypothetical protein
MTSTEIANWAILAANSIWYDSPAKWMSDDDKISYVEAVIAHLEIQCDSLDFATHPEHYEVPEQAGQLRPDSATECAPIAGHPAL